MISTENKNLKEFAEALATCNGLEICAVAKLMGVSLLSEDGSALTTGEDLVTNILTTFMSYDRKRRRNMMKFMKQVKKENLALPKEVTVSGNNPEAQ